MKKSKHYRAKIYVWVFQSGNQGFTQMIGTIERVVHEYNVRLPSGSCTTEPLREETLRVVSYCGQDYACRPHRAWDRTDITTGKMKRDPIRDGELTLHLSSDKPIAKDLRWVDGVRDKDGRIIKWR